MTGTTPTSKPDDANAAPKRLGAVILDRFAGFSKGSDLRAAFRFRILHPESLTGLAILAFWSSLCGTAIVFLLNKEAKSVEYGEYTAWLALLFVAILLAHRAGERALLSHTSAAIEQALDDWRSRIGRKVTELDLRETEDLSRGTILDGLARYYDQLSQSIVPLVSGLEGAILLVFMLAYLFSLSVLAGLMTVVIIAGMILSYASSAATVHKSMQETNASTASLSRLAEDMFDGFKELKLSESKRTAIQAEMEASSHDVARSRSRTADITSQRIAFGNASAYLMAAAAVFLLPIFSAEEHGISRIVTAVLFLLGPLAGVVMATQPLAIARFSIKAIDEFEQQLDERLAHKDVPGPDYRAFRSLSIANGRYAHRGQAGEAGFSVQDLSAEFERGQIIFITGANGSGKTTALRMLTGLYPLQAGAICIDGRLVEAPAPQTFRDLFSTVFADYHIFNKPYGLDDDGIARLEAAIDMVRIRDKLPEDLCAGLNRDALSTGQRKRLALALALAEDRPILLLDEWAADQDPTTRERFYREILPMLKKDGKTVIAVTHDERYFDCADTRYHMDEGRMTRVTP